MSNMPLISETKQRPWYGASADQEETTTLLIKSSNKNNTDILDVSTAEVIYELFLQQEGNWDDLFAHPKTNPKMTPEKRFKRHRNYYVYQLNQFRHWWKTSRLLVRVSGGYEYCQSTVNWVAMAAFKVTRRKQAKAAFRSMKAIGRGGPSKDFLNNVQPFTRSIRIVLAVARGWEARVDNRLVEVFLAEGFAFMGNRCSRWVARTFADSTTKNILLPYLGALYLQHNLDQRSRPIIVTMGFLRAILPFAMSFQGSRLGRQLTYNTFNYAFFRWRPVQCVTHFHQHAGVFQDTVLDPELEELAHEVAVAIGTGQDPSETRKSMALLGFHVVGCGQGGYAVYRKRDLAAGKILFVHVTPYGPSILDEMPRYVVLERKTVSTSSMNDWVNSSGTLLDAAVPPEATTSGFTYLGAFFKCQEWAALTTRFQETLESYEIACRRFGTVGVLKGKNAIRTPPSNLATLKEFIRTGHTPKKHRKDAKRWKQLSAEIKKLSKLVAKYQKQGTAPKRVILYLEGLDCSAKSSTGGMIFSALEGCGYAVRTAQHNRPPTAEQRKKPWMDRGRFERPDDVYQHGEEIPEYTALVWDRGPAGDFVYGGFSKLDEATKEERYDEFRSYDTLCRQEGVLFCKLLFVADKDSIASTLGKRLAHKKIARDLRTWLDANSIEHYRPGLEEIEHHIDPTDFVAFNKYKQNLAIFADFARSTDDITEQEIDGIRPRYENPWTVVNTAKRHPARLALLRTFESQLKRFAKGPSRSLSLVSRLQRKLKLSFPFLKDDAIIHYGVVEDKIDGQMSLRAVIQAFLLILLFFFYLYTTWKVDIRDVFNDED